MRKDISSVIIEYDTLDEFREDRDNLIIDYSGDLRGAVIRIKTCTDDLSGLWDGSDLVYPPLVIEILRNSELDPHSAVNFDRFFANCSKLKMWSGLHVIYNESKLYKMDESELVDRIVTEVCRDPKYVLPVLEEFEKYGDRKFSIVIDRKDNELSRLLDIMSKEFSNTLIKNIVKELDKRLRNFVFSDNASFDFNIQEFTYDSHHINIFIDKTELKRNLS